MKNPQQLVGAPIVESLAGGGKGPYAGKTVWITYGNPPPDPRDEEISRLKEALRPLAAMDCQISKPGEPIAYAFDPWRDAAPVFSIGSDRVITAGDLRRARAALNGENE